MKRILVVLAAVALVLGGWPVRARAEQVAGRSAILMELSTGTVLFAQNEHTPLPPASVTKVMTLLLVMEAIDSGRLHWQEPVTASEAAAAKGGSQVYLKVGERMSVEQLVKGVAVSSANDCACALAEHLCGTEAAFVEKMNRRAAQLGMAHTHFVNCTGLDDAPEAKDHLTSAHDIALMSRQLLVAHPDIKKYTTIWTDTLRDGSFGLSNTNKLVRFYPGATGLKTGFTAGAGYCLSASAQREGMELVAVVMGCESSRERFDTCRRLLDRGFADYTLATPTLPGDLQVAVTLGRADRVSVAPAHTEPLLLDRAHADTVRTQYTLQPTVTAPVSKGQRLGTATVLAGDKVLRQLPLVATEAIPRLGITQLFKRLLQKVLGA